MAAFFRLPTAPLAEKNHRQGTQPGHRNQHDDNSERKVIKREVIFHRNLESIGCVDSILIISLFQAIERNHGVIVVH